MNQSLLRYEPNGISWWRWEHFHRLICIVSHFRARRHLYPRRWTQWVDGSASLCLSLPHLLNTLINPVAYERLLGGIPRGALCPAQIDFWVDSEKKRDAFFSSSSPSVSLSPSKYISHTDGLTSRQHIHLRTSIAKCWSKGLGSEHDQYYTSKLPDYCRFLFDPDWVVRDPG